MKSQPLLGLQVLSFLAAALAPGCSWLDGATNQTAVEIHMKVALRSEDNSGAIVAGVSFSEGKRLLGVTNSAGVLQTVVTGLAGSTHSFAVKCPNGFASPEQNLDVKVALLASSSPVPQFVARCTALLHSVVLGIRTENGPNLPVLYLGKEVTRTDSTGVAHVSLELPPGETASVTLDTTSARGLSPENPSLVFKAGDKDELLLLEQRFTAPKRPIVVVKSNRPEPL